VSAESESSRLAENVVHFTRLLRAAGRKAATTRKRREAARKAAVTRAKNKR